MLSFYDRFSSRQYLYALACGLLLPLANAPFEIKPLAWLSPALFFALNLGQMRSKQRSRMAWCYGIGVFGAGAHWIYTSIHYFGGANAFIAASMVAVFVVVVAWTFVPVAWLMSATSVTHNTIRCLLIFPSSWVLGEWLRSWFFTGFPWIQLSHSQADTWLGSLAPIGGSLLVSFAVAVGAGCIVLFWQNRVRLHRIIALALFAAVLAMGYGAQWLEFTHAKGRALYTNLVQGNIKQSEKWVPELANQHIQKQMDLMAGSMAEADVVVWSETAIPDYFNSRMNDVILPLQELVSDMDNTLVLGGFYAEDDNKVYNAIMSIAQDRQIYGKKHLVPFSEYIPLLHYLRWLEHFLILPYDNVTAWQGPTNLNIKGEKVRMSVCFEDVFGSEMRKGLPEASLLLNVSNNGWFTGTIQPAQHLEIARMRSLETGRWMIRSTNNGRSAIIDHLGKITVSATPYTAAVLKGFAQPRQGITPFVRFGHWPLIIMLSFVVGLYIWLGYGKFR